MARATGNTKVSSRWLFSVGTIPESSPSTGGRSPAELSLLEILRASSASSAFVATAFLGRRGAVSQVRFVLEFFAAGPTRSAGRLALSADWPGGGAARRFEPSRPSRAELLGWLSRRAPGGRLLGRASEQPAAGGLGDWKESLEG